MKERSLIKINNELFISFRDYDVKFNENFDMNMLNRRYKENGKERLERNPDHIWIKHEGIITKGDLIKMIMSRNVIDFYIKQKSSNDRFTVVFK